MRAATSAAHSASFDFIWRQLLKKARIALFGSYAWRREYCHRELLISYEINKAEVNTHQARSRICTPRIARGTSHLIGEAAYLI